jgi:small GTP-binding protein
MTLLSLPSQMKDLQVVLRGLDWHALEEEVDREMRSRLAIVGPVNSGKSTLFNHLHGKRISAVSAVPGTTRGVVEQPLGPFSLVDTPGFGEVWGVDRAATALEVARGADVILLLLDAAAGVRQADRDLYARLYDLGVPVVVALNKTDLIQKDLLWVLENAEELLGVQPIPISARTGAGVASELVPALLRVQPALTVAMARELPAIRDRLVQRIIRRATWFSALVSLQPVPGLDVPVLLAAQTRMVLRVAAAHGEEMSVSHARELLTAMAGGLLSRYLGAQLAKLVPVLGWLVSASISGASTWAIGQAAHRYFAAGRQISPPNLQGLYRRLRRVAPRRWLRREEEDGREREG